MENFVRACRQNGVDARSLCAVDDVLDEIRPNKIAETLEQLLLIDAGPNQRGGEGNLRFRGRKTSPGKKKEESNESIAPNSNARNESGGTESLDDKVVNRHPRQPSPAKMQPSVQDRFVSYLCLFLFLTSILLLSVYPYMLSLAS